jgi:type II secretory pathway component PulM
MKMKLREFWDARPPQERAVIAALVFILGAALYLWLAHAADRARTQLRATTTTLRAQASGIEQQAVELGRLRATPAAASSRTDLRTLVQAQADAAGLSGALGRIEARDANQVQVVFGSVAFADWLAWVGTLQALQVRLDACRIETLSAPGLVGVTATFVRAQPQ